MGGWTTCVSLASVASVPHVVLSTSLAIVRSSRLLLLLALVLSSISGGLLSLSLFFVGSSLDPGLLLAGEISRIKSGRNPNDCSSLLSMEETTHPFQAHCQRPW